MAEWPMTARRKSKANSHPSRSEGGGEKVSDSWTIKVSQYPKTKQTNLLNATEFIVGWFTYRGWVRPEKTSQQSAQLILHYYTVITSNARVLWLTRQGDRACDLCQEPHLLGVTLDNHLAPMLIPVWYAPWLLGPLHDYIVQATVHSQSLIIGLCILARTS